MASCAEAGFTPDVAFTVDDPVAAQELVAAGLGVAVLYGLALAARRDPRVRTVGCPVRTGSLEPRSPPGRYHHR